MGRESIYNHNFDPDEMKVGLNFAHEIRDAVQFQAAANHFTEFNVYTKYPYNTHPRSRYSRFWREEKRRCIEGYHIGRDFITGYHYYYLNYGRIPIVIYDMDNPKVVKKLKEGNQVKGKRIFSFPAMWDYDYYFFHYIEEAENSGEHGGVLKSRGQGYSNKGAAMLVRNFHLIDGSKNFVLAYDKRYLTGSDGIMSKFDIMRSFVTDHTEFYKHTQKIDKADHKRASYITKVMGKNVEKGSMAEVSVITLGGSLEGARGIRGKLILWEEAGRFPGMMDAWQITMESVQQDGVTYGTMLAFGTGGSSIESFETLNELYNKPEAYNIKSIPNIWSKSPKANNSAFYVPSYANRISNMDKNGNSDIEAAYAMEQSAIEKMESNNASKRSINQRIAERAKHPEESLLVKEGSDFPTREINSRLHDIEGDKKLEAGKRAGYMRIKEGVSTFVQSGASSEITMFPHNKGEYNEGAVVLYELPYKEKGEVPLGMYIAGIDPYDHDKSTTASLGSIFIMSRATRLIVAEHTGRPRKADDFYEQCRLMLLYYNAIANYENNLIGLKKYFEVKNSLYLLAKDLQLYRKITKMSKVEREYGTPGTSPINNYGRGLLVEWLGDKVLDTEETTFVATVESKGLLLEMRAYDGGGNYDRISAMGMLMLLLKEYGVLGAEFSKNKENEDKKKKKDEEELLNVLGIVNKTDLLGSFKLK